MDDHKEMYPQATAETAKEKADLAPKQVEAWRTFNAPGFLKKAWTDEKTKQLIAVAVAHVTQCPYCKSHVPQALRKGATKQEIMEAIW